MSDMPRQPLPVTLTFEGKPQDIQSYQEKIKRLIESRSYDHVKIDGPTLIIYPGAVNE